MGVDLIKNIKVLKKAYNDSSGFAAQFNLNLITRMNNELKTKLKQKDFKYVSFFNKKSGCIQCFLLSKKNQTFYLNKRKFFLKKGEKIQTETSKKFTFKTFSKLAGSSGWKVSNYWYDKKKCYSIFLLK